MKDTTVKRALVELAVVVVGIVIALGVDRLNQQRIDDNTEAEYLTALSTDLEADTAALTGLLEAFRARSAAAGRVRRLLGSDSLSVPDPAALAWDINYARYVTSFDPTDFTYRELISTGGLALIDDQTLKREIVAYYEQVQFVSQFYPVWQAPSRSYGPTVRELLQPGDWAVIQSQRGGPGVETELDVAGVLEALRNGGAVEKLLSSIEVALFEVETTHEDLKTAATELLASLEAARR